MDGARDTPTAGRWWLQELGIGHCRLLWPIAAANGEAQAPSEFCHRIEDWLRARAGRRVFGLGRDDGPLWAGFLLDPPPPDRPVLFTVPRLWLVEPARSGTVARPLFAAMAAVVTGPDERELWIPYRALVDPRLGRALDGPADQLGYMVAGDGWRRRVPPGEVRRFRGGCEGDRPMRRILSIVLALPLLVVAARAWAAQLVMFESAYCEWCERWHEEIGPIYPRTPEARIAPLRRVDVDGPRPPDLAFVKGIRYTPTFVLVENGREIGRITGYPGEDFFWPLLAELLARLPPHGEEVAAHAATD